LPLLALEELLRKYVGSVTNNVNQSFRLSVSRNVNTGLEFLYIGCRLENESLNSRLQLRGINDRLRSPQIQIYYAVSCCNYSDGFGCTHPRYRCSFEKFSNCYCYFYLFRNTVSFLTCPTIHRSKDYSSPSGVDWSSITDWPYVCWKI
jgi:hypothetical protein